MRSRDCGDQLGVRGGGENLSQAMIRLLAGKCAKLAGLVDNVPEDCLIEA